jgi:phosphate starvation-inducible PhoH-like protein
MRKEITVNELVIPIIFGQNDEYLKFLKKKTNVNISNRMNKIYLEGTETEVTFVEKFIVHLINISSKRQLSINNIEETFKMLKGDDNTDVSSVMTESIKVSGWIKEVYLKTENQQKYINAIRKNDIVFAIGPAGTGKTYLAMAMAINFFLNKEVNRIILARPAVEAGESLGFLPGDIVAKINPYLRPLYDALYNMMDIEKANRFIEKGIIELAPLAYMRGRTLNDAFIILDEAQNTTLEQMKMFLTRLGFHSKAVITGDITQIDLPINKKSGLVLVQNILAKTDGIKFVYFTDKDVVRHPLVQSIIKAFDKYEEKTKNSN